MRQGLSDCHVSQTQSHTAWRQKRHTGVDISQTSHTPQVIVLADRRCSGHANCHAGPLALTLLAPLRCASHLELAGGCASTNLMSALECFSLMCFAHVWRASALLSADLEVLLQHSLVTAIKILNAAPAACRNMLTSAPFGTSNPLIIPTL